MEPFLCITCPLQQALMLSSLMRSCFLHFQWLWNKNVIIIPQAGVVCGLPALEWREVDWSYTRGWASGGGPNWEIQRSNSRRHPLIKRYIWSTPIKHKPNCRKLGSDITEWLWIKGPIKLIIVLYTYWGLEFSKEMVDGLIFYPSD